MKVSVIISVYNREKYIEECIESILNQDFTNFELIVVDDGSTDKTLEILNNFNDDRIRVIKLPVNCGIGTAKNVALSSANGEYIAIMDSDDVAVPYRLTKQVDFLDQNTEIDILGARGVIYEGDKDNILFYSKQPENDADIKARMLFLNGSAMLHPTMMLRSEFIKKHGLYYENKMQDEDHAFWIKSIYHGAKFYNLTDELIYKRKHDESVTVKLKSQTFIKERKIPLVIELLSMYYPQLSVSNIKHMAELLYMNQQMDVVKTCKGINAIEEAILEQRSFYGESKRYLNTILNNFRNDVLKKIPHKFTNGIKT